MGKARRTGPVSLAGSVGSASSVVFMFNSPKRPKNGGGLMVSTGKSVNANWRNVGVRTTYSAVAEKLPGLPTAQGWRPSGASSNDRSCLD